MVWGVMCVGVDRRFADLVDGAVQELCQFVACGGEEQGRDALVGGVGEEEGGGRRGEEDGEVAFGCRFGAPDQTEEPVGVQRAEDVHLHVRAEGSQKDDGGGRVRRVRVEDRTEKSRAGEVFTAVGSEVVPLGVLVGDEGVGDVPLEG